MSTTLVKGEHFCLRQEAAIGIGYGAAALELWEEFVIRFFKYETQLGAVVPKEQIANHLQQLAQLYETSSPELSNIYALLSCLSPDQLPGHTFLPSPTLSSGPLFVTLAALVTLPPFVTLAPSVPSSVEGHVPQQSGLLHTALPAIMTNNAAQCGVMLAIARCFALSGSTSRCDRVSEVKMRLLGSDTTCLHDSVQERLDVFVKSTCLYAPHYALHSLHA